MGEQDRLERAEAVYRACRVTDRLFAMNPYLPQQNFYSQQLRALALVEVLSELQLQEGWRSVVVVGAELQAARWRQHFPPSAQMYGSLKHANAHLNGIGMHNIESFIQISYFGLIKTPFLRPHYRS